MKILHIIAGLHTGGAEKLLLDLLPRIKKTGHGADLYVLDNTPTYFSEKLREAGITIYTPNRNSSVYNPFHILRLIKYIRKYDIVHTHTTPPQFMAAFVSMLYRKVTYFTTEHATSNRRRNKWWCKPIDKWMYSRYKRIICVSKETEVKLREYLNLEFDTRIVTIYNGIDFKYFSTAKPYMDLREIHDIIIIMVGRFVEPKDQDTLIKSLKLLPPNYKLWLLGDGSRRKDLEKLSESEGVANRVKFWGIRPDVAELLKTADLVVLSSHYEGLSLAGLEGMSAGKPFIASDVAGLHDITYGAGVLFPEGDVEVLSKEITHIMNAPSYYHTVSEQCAKRASEYDIANTAEQYNRLYNQLLRNGRNNS